MVAPMRFFSVAPLEMMVVMMMPCRLACPSATNGVTLRCELDEEGIHDVSNCHGSPIGPDQDWRLRRGWRFWREESVSWKAGLQKPSVRR